MNTIPLKYSVFPKDENPLFSEFATHISIDDDAAGAYIVIEQFPDEGCQTIKLDLPELEELLRLANKLMAAYDYATGEKPKYKIEQTDVGPMFRFVSLVDDKKGSWQWSETEAKFDAQTYFQRNKE